MGLVHGRQLRQCIPSVLLLLLPLSHSYLSGGGIESKVRKQCVNTILQLVTADRYIRTHRAQRCTGRTVMVMHSHEEKNATTLSLTSATHTKAEEK